MTGPLVQRVAELCSSRGLLPRGATVAVAVSGGLDSVVLLDVLLALRGLFGIHLVVATVDHGLRGMASVEDARFVRGLARAAGVPFYGGRLRVPPGAGLEEAARNQRLAFLEGVPAHRVALAHHLDDQAETVLLRVARGSGLEGLGAMAPARGPFIRPLLRESRDALITHAEGRGLAWREDVTNALLDRERNRVRHDLLPSLDQIHGGAARRLAFLADLIERDAAFVERAMAETAGVVQAGGGLRRRVLQEIDVALRGRWLRRLVVSEAGVLPARGSVEAALRLVERGHPGAWVPVGRGWRLAVDPDMVRCLPQPPAPLRLGRGCRTWGVYNIAVGWEGPGPPGGMVVRPPAPGERLSGAPLLERLRAHGVSPSLRPYHPVFEHAGSVLWVPPRAPVAQGTGGVHITVSPIPTLACPGSAWRATL